MNMYSIHSKKELYAMMKDAENMVRLRAKRHKRIVIDSIEEEDSSFQRFILKDSEQLLKELEDRHKMICEAYFLKDKPKKNVTIKLDLDTISKLKMLSDTRKMSQANIIEQLVDLSEMILKVRD